MIFSSSSFLFSCSSAILLSFSNNDSLFCSSMSSSAFLESVLSSSLTSFLLTRKCSNSSSESLNHPFFISIPSLFSSFFSNAGPPSSGSCCVCSCSLLLSSVLSVSGPFVSTGISGFALSDVTSADSKDRSSPNTNCLFNKSC